MLAKKNCRKLMKAWLSSLDKESYIKLSESLSDKLNLFLNELHVIQEKKMIGAFAPLVNEPQWALRLDGEFQGCLAFPSLADGEDVMTFKASLFSELECRSDFGVEILAPRKTSADVMPDILLIPGLAFDREGRRLGRGRGFYDKFLNNFRGIKIGLCFEGQLIERVPTLEHDVKMNFILTNRELIKIK
jgi:5-formyltetrahydrofolate cyclo-ligase